MRLSLRSSRLWLLVGLVTTSMTVVFIVSAGAVISPPTCATVNHVTGSNFEIEPNANLLDGPETASTGSPAGQAARSAQACWRRTTSRPARATTLSAKAPLRTTRTRRWSPGRSRRTRAT